MNEDVVRVEMAGHRQSVIKDPPAREMAEDRYGVPDQPVGRVRDDRGEIVPAQPGFPQRIADGGTDRGRVLGAEPGNLLRVGRLSVRGYHVGEGTRREKPAERRLAAGRRLAAEG
jgi:hypothetical protein